MSSPRAQLRFDAIGVEVIAVRIFEQLQCGDRSSEQLRRVDHQHGIFKPVAEGTEDRGHRFGATALADRSHPRGVAVDLDLVFRPNVPLLGGDVLGLGESHG